MRFYLRIFSNRRYDGAYLYLNEYSRYTVFEFSKEMTFNSVAFKANSRSKLKIWLDLNGYTIGRTYGVVRSKDKRLGSVIFRLHRK